MGDSRFSEAARAGGPVLRPGGVGSLTRRDPTSAQRLFFSSEERARSLVYRSLGAHLDTVEGNAGTQFAVWAPNAAAVSVICDSNGWTPDKDRLTGSDSGVWSGFLPGIGHGATYKYAIQTRDGRVLEKTDPVAFATETPPRTASIVYDLSDFQWNDDEWLSKRRTTDWHRQPIAIYEVHLGSWKRPQDKRRYYS